MIRTRIRTAELRNPSRAPILPQLYKGCDMRLATEPREVELQAAVASAKPPFPKTPRPIVILGAGGIVRAAHLPAYKKSNLPVVAVADIVPGKAAPLASEFNISHYFDSVDAAVRFAPPDAVFDIAVPAAQLVDVLPLLPTGS